MAVYGAADGGRDYGQERQSWKVARANEIRGGAQWADHLEQLKIKAGKRMQGYEPEREDHGGNALLLIRINDAQQRASKLRAQVQDLNERLAWVRNLERPTDVVGAASVAAPKGSASGAVHMLDVLIEEISGVSGYLARLVDELEV